MYALVVAWLRKQRPMPLPRPLRGMGLCLLGQAGTMQVGLDMHGAPVKPSVPVPFTARSASP